MTNEELIQKLNEKTDNSFKFDKVENINHRPHPYCITNKHLKYNDSIYLGEEQILRMEKEHGPMCGMYTNGSGWTNGYKQGYKRCTLSYEEHTSNTVMFVKCFKEDFNKELFKQIINEYETELTKAVEGFVFVRSWDEILLEDDKETSR